jgi:hypothetical protein
MYVNTWSRVVMENVNDSYFGSKKKQLHQLLDAL